MNRLLEKAQALFDRQRLAGKLKLFLLMLFSVLLLSGLAVWGSLALVYSSNSALWALERYAAQLAGVERAILRFRVTHERAEAQIASNYLIDADQQLKRIHSQLWVSPAPSAGTDIFALNRDFSEQLRTYLYFHEQSAALTSSVRLGGKSLQESLYALQAQQWPEHLLPQVAQLALATMQSRLLLQEYLREPQEGLVLQTRDSLLKVIDLALDLRRRSRQLESGVEAYVVAQETQVLLAGFSRFAEFGQQRLYSEASLLQTTNQIVEWVRSAAERQREAIVRQIVFIVVSMALATVLLLMLGSVLGRRFVRGLAQPLTELVQMSASLVHGNYARRINDRRPDEVGDLARSFNIMAETIQAKIDAMREADLVLRARTEELEVSNQALAEAKKEADTLNASLERKVRERTSELEKANRQLVELTITDPLTGLANRRRFNDTMAEEWARAQRSGQPVAMLMLDIDYFKAYNDCCGHQAGDDCLRKVAGLVRGAARRAGDLVARYGGEEFVVIAADTDIPDAINLAESMRAAVERAAIPHPVSSLAGGVVTVSIGVAVMVPSFGVSPERLMQRADAALYLAKSGGRNRVVKGDESRLT